MFASLCFALLLGIIFIQKGFFKTKILIYQKIEEEEEKIIIFLYSFCIEMKEKIVNSKNNKKRGRNMQ